MKETIPCHNCQNCAIGFTIGFTGVEVLHCAKQDSYVTREDGCTMGVPGKPATLCSAAEVCLSGHEAVWGWH